MSRKLANLYSESKTNSRTGHRQYIYGKDGTLFSGGTYPTKITAEDLPEWYVYGRYMSGFSQNHFQSINTVIFYDIIQRCICRAVKIQMQFIVFLIA